MNDDLQELVRDNGQTIDLQSIRELVSLPAQSESTPQSEAPRNQRQPAPPHIITATIQFDAGGDVRYTHHDPDFRQVAHLFHQDWHGIRSAAGTLPGHKIAVPLNMKVRSRDISLILSQLANWGVDKVVFHGFSPVAEAILRALKSAGLRNYLVWHGNLSQLVWEPEVHFFESAFQASKQGYFSRSHMLKGGMGAIFPNSFVPMLINWPPLIPRQRAVPAFGSKHRIAIIPAHLDIRKNVYTSLVGTCLSRSIHDVLYYGKIKAKLPSISRARRVIYSGHDKHLSLMQNVDACVNVTTIDCHPMVDLEALACGAFPITGPLFLDALQNHPFTRLSEVTNPFDVGEIARRLDSVGAMDNSELHSIMCDYSAKLGNISRDRYKEFLEL
jgi:hypothetical protein